MSAREGGFGSVLAFEIQRYLIHKRALGRRFKSEESELRLLDRFILAQEVEALADITPRLLEDFLASRPRLQPRSYNHLLGVVRGLFNWLVIQETMDISPLRVKPRRARYQLAPFLFDQGLARRLLDAAAKLPDRSRGPLRGPTYRLAFALMYGLGLRVGEVARLARGDIDLERHLLCIRQTKFCKDRLVPFGPRMEIALLDFIEARSTRHGTLRGDSPLFSFDGQRPPNPYTFTQTFRRLAKDLGLAAPPGVAPPCAHHLRHSFAVGTLLRWYRQGMDPNQRLQRLSTFLGHVDPVSTAIYLTITDELREQACRRFERFAAPILEGTP